MSDEQRADEIRRRLIRGVAAGSGAFTLTQWSKPVVKTVMLPAHAQTSPAPDDDDDDDDGPNLIPAEGFDGGTASGLVIGFDLD